MAHYHIEVGGGLGDVIAQCYDNGRYNILRDLQPEDTAEVHVFCHNPHAKELFTLHPKANQITVRDWGYMDTGDHSEWRKENGLPVRPPELPVKDRNIQFSLTPEDKRVGMEVVRTRGERPLVVIAAGAGLAGRNILHDDLDKIVMRLREEFALVFIGRNYDRQGRREPNPPFWGECVNLIDKLSVPGTCRLVQEADGLITCHSAMNLLGWYERIPQLLLYPESVRDTHIASRDQWAFGIDFPECVHAEFSDFRMDSEGYIDRFVRQVRANVVKKGSS